MTRAKLLHQNPLHARAENTDFITRMRFKKGDEVALKSDCINLALQYVAIYQALENRLQQLLFTESYMAIFRESYLAIFNKEPWGGRSIHLKKDVAEMKSFLSAEDQRCLIDDNHLFQATRNMITNIEQADQAALYAWFMVRCLGDAFGGQGIKVYNQRIFGDNQLTAHFANGVSKEANPLCQIVNKTELSEDEEALFLQTADTVFQLHIDLYEEMERDRVLPEVKNEQPDIITDITPEDLPVFKKHPPHASYSNGCKFLMFTSLAVGTIATVAGAYCAMSGPQK